MFGSLAWLGWGQAGESTSGQINRRSVLGLFQYRSQNFWSKYLLVFLEFDAYSSSCSS